MSINVGCDNKNTHKCIIRSYNDWESSVWTHMESEPGIFPGEINEAQKEYMICSHLCLKRWDVYVRDDDRW